MIYGAAASFVARLLGHPRGGLLTAGGEEAETHPSFGCLRLRSRRTVFPGLLRQLRPPARAGPVSILRLVGGDG